MASVAGCALVLVCALLLHQQLGCSAMRTAHKYPLFKSKWNIDPSNGFFDLPRTAQELRRAGNWAEISNCNGNFDSNFPGDRYIETPVNDDTDDLVLIFDGAGFIAGYQVVVPANLTFQDQFQSFTSSRYFQPGVLRGQQVFFFTAYFISPERICQGGRSEWQFDQQGTLDRLHVQTGPTPDNVVSFPFAEDAMRNEPGFFEQNCFPTMGTHYIGTDETLPGYDDSCRDTPPFSVIYNKGHLNAVAFVTFAPITGRRIEVSTAQSLVINFLNPPKCLEDYVQTPGIRGMHIFFDDYTADCSNRKSIVNQRAGNN